VSLDILLRQREAAFALEPEQREVAIVIVGTGRAPGLDRMAHFLADRYGISLTVVTFEVSALEDHRQILVREITEVATSEPLSVRALKTTLGQVLELAECSGTSLTLRHGIAICERLGLYARPWKTSIMFAPPANRTTRLVHRMGTALGRFDTYVGRDQGLCRVLSHIRGVCSRSPWG
jgi:hypothetical protein